MTAGCFFCVVSERFSDAGEFPRVLQQLGVFGCGGDRESLGSMLDVLNDIV
jgi:hypothetical protein